jgi:hypothetical protein
MNEEQRIVNQNNNNNGNNHVPILPTTGASKSSLFLLKFHCNTESASFLTEDIEQINHCIIICQQTALLL